MRARVSEGWGGSARMGERWAGRGGVGRVEEGRAMLGAAKSRHGGRLVCGVIAQLIQTWNWMPSVASSNPILELAAFVRRRPCAVARDAVPNTRGPKKLQSGLKRRAVASLCAGAMVRTAG